jgi:hypothetical protein
MDEKKRLGELPKKLKISLLEKGLLTDEALIFAETDMEVDCEFRHRILILTEKNLIIGTNCEKTENLIDFSPFSTKRRKADD